MASSSTSNSQKALKRLTQAYQKLIQSSAHTFVPLDELVKVYAAYKPSMSLDEAEQQIRSTRSEYPNEVIFSQARGKKSKLVQVIHKESQE